MSSAGGKAPDGVFGQAGAYYVRFNGRDVPIHYGSAAEALIILDGLRGIRTHEPVPGLTLRGGIPR